MLQIGLLIIGDEILSGRRADKHFAHAVLALARRGLELSWARYVGDDAGLLVRSFQDIRATGELCFAFGGIGATPDDRTRLAIAEALGVPLVRHPEAVAEMEKRFGEAAYPNRIRMAELPEGASIIPNPVSRIPGFSLGEIHCLPGFPEMAWPMMEWVLDTHYPNLLGTQPVQCTLTIRGTPESELVQLLESMQSAHPKVRLSSLPSYLPEGGFEIELAVRGEGEAAVQAFEALKAALTDQSVEFEGGPDTA
jgi:molybdopterin-biosynthesis enzyme MoeA-like protein